MNFLQLSRNVARLLFPDRGNSAEPLDGIPQGLLVPFQMFCWEAMRDLQDYVDGLQVDHVSIYRQCATTFRCGQTYIDAPDGQVSRVFTVYNSGAVDEQDDYCAHVNYNWASFPALHHWSRLFSIRVPRMPDNTGLLPLTLGFKYPEAVTDSEYGRARSGIWTIHKRQLIVAPWIQSTEKLVVQWSGKKSTWGDQDLVVDDARYFQVVREYVKAQWSRIYDKDTEAYQQALFEWQAARSQFIRESDKKDVPALTDLNSAQDGIMMDYNEATGISAAIDISAPVEQSAATTRWAFLSDYGAYGLSDGETIAVKAVSDLITAQLITGKSEADQAAAFIVTGGDNDQREVDTLGYDDTVGINYHQWILPYKGNKGAGSPYGNRFFPAIGNHDDTNQANRGEVANYSAYLAFMPVQGQRYYDFVKGDCHFFIFNGDHDVTSYYSKEPDGYMATDKQGLWLSTRMALSTAKWKIVVIHYPLWSSGNHGDDTMLQWIATLEPDLILSGHDHIYERSIVGNVTQVVAGIGGKALTGILVEQQYSVIRATGKYGAVFFEATEAQITGTAIATTGAVMDSFVITKAVAGKPTVATMTNNITNEDDIFIEINQA